MNTNSVLFDQLPGAQVTPARPPATVLDSLAPAPEVGPHLSGSMRLAALAGSRRAWLQEAAQDPAIALAAHVELEAVLQELRGHLAAAEDLLGRIPDLRTLAAGMSAQDRQKLAQDGRLRLRAPRVGSREPLVDLARWWAAESALVGEK